MNVRFAEPHDYPSLSRFNERLTAAGRDDQITLSPSLRGESRYRPEGFPVFRRLMIAEDGEEVRAVWLICHHNLFLRGRRLEFCWTDNAICEGVIDRKYSLAIIQLVNRALTYQPFLMALGAGSPQQDATRFLIKLGWRHAVIPFLFYPIQVSKVLLGLRHLKNGSRLRYASLLAAYSGLGAGLSGLFALRRRLGVTYSGYERSLEGCFDDWADRLFENSLKEYGAVIRSDATTLNISYPPDDPRFTRIRVRRKNDKQDAGWIVVIDKQMRDNKYFGDLRVGTLVDGFGRPSDVPALIAAGLDHLAEAGVDIVVANFSHAAWVRASRRLGMLPGPSNFYFFVSPTSPPLLDTFCPLHEIHLARGHNQAISSLLE